MDKPVERIPGYSNYQESLVVENLCNAPLSALPIDEFAPALFKEVGQSKEDFLLALRFAVIRVYLLAASIRLNAKAAGKQITSATKAASLMMEAIDHLSRVEPFPSWGLNAASAVPYPDPKGLSEPSTFTHACWEAKLNIVSTVMRLIEAISQEKHKPGSKGERKKQLQILVEALSDWWGVDGKINCALCQSKAARQCSGRRDWSLWRLCFIRDCRVLQIGQLFGSRGGRYNNQRSQSPLSQIKRRRHLHKIRMVRGQAVLPLFSATQRAA